MSELLENTNFRGAHDTLFNFTTVATVQRLGYIVDEILEERGHADIIYNELKLYSNHFRYCWLSTKHDKKKSAISEKWKLYINTEIEPDEI